MWNSKCLRIKNLKDRLLIRSGPHAPSLEKAVELLLELIGAVHSPQYLNWVRRETAKLRERFPDPTVEQLQRLVVLDARIEKKQQLIQERAERRKAKKASEKDSKKAKRAASAPGAPAATSGGTRWD